MATKGNVSIKIEDDDDVEVGGEADSLWSKKNEAFFIDIMEEEVKTMGSRDTGTFQIKSWARMRKSLSAKAKYEYSELQIKNKFNQLRIMHTKFKSLCDQSGVGWCAEKGTVTADDTLWEKLYKVNKKAKHFRKKGFPHYAAMTRILGDTTATGFNAHPSVQSPSGTDSSDPSFKLKQDKDDGEIEVTNMVVSGKGKKVFDMKALKTIEPKESSKSKKRDSLSANLSASLSALAESSKRKVDILEAKHNAKSTSVSVTSQDHGEPQGLLAECIKTLNAMEDLDGASYTKGMKLLKDDPSWRPIFLGMSEQRKKDFLSYDNMVFEEGQSSESVNNICKSDGHVHDYESLDTISLKLGQMESSDDSDKELESDSDDETIIALVTLALHEHHQKYYNRIPCRTSILRGHDYVLEVLNGHDARCEEGFRMETHVFIAFCEALKVHSGLKHSRYLTVPEQVCIFLLVVGHNSRNRIIQERFQHSGETISKYFKRVLKAVCKLGKLIIQPPPFDEVPPEIMHNPKYWPFFKDCIGAIDGTHIDAKVPAREQIPYRGRHKTTSQNVMAACSFDMRFTYVLSGWEGTANDSRVLVECANNPAMEFPMAPLGKYYVVDSGYQNMPGFLTPYKGERYHLSLFRGRRRLPTKEEEWFNYRHSSLRNVIERCFGALKARFPILKQMPKGFSVRTQRYLPTACCTVHNFIRMHDKNDAVFKFYSKEDLIVESEQGRRSSSQQINVTPAQLREMARVRNTIARQIFNSQRL